MTKKANIKEQRDRFLAFAFASADLFLEVAPSGKITFTLGAVKGVTGANDQELLGKNWMDIFDPAEQARLKNLQDESIPGKRCGPLLITMDEKISARKGIITGIKMPGRENFYITLGLSNELTEKLAALEESGFDDSVYNKDKHPDDGPFDDSVYNKDKHPDDGPFDDSVYNKDKHPDDEPFDDSVYNKEEFLDEAESVFEFARTQNKEAEVTCFDFGRTEAIPEADIGALMDEVATLLRSQAIDGRAAGEISEGRFSLIHEAGTDTADINRKISDIVKKHLPPEAGADFSVTSQTIKADINNTSSEEAARGLSYAVNAFEQSGAKDLDIKDLKTSLKTLATSNKEKIKKLKSMIDRIEFTFNFMPIVNLEEKIADHYEILCRFETEETGDTKEWIMLGEDVGLASKLDLAVCERALNHIHFKEGGTRTKFSVNFSTYALDDKKFTKKFMENIEKQAGLADRLSFELTQSDHIHNLETMKRFMELLKSKGHAVGLDDFSLTPQSLQNLQILPVDYIKMASKYTHQIKRSLDTVKMIQRLVRTCQKTSVKVIAKHVESREQAAILKEIGIEYAQGYLFAKPSTKPNYIA